MLRRTYAGIKSGVTDAAVEKHVPVYTVEGSHVHVVVGETKHPMLEEHFIEWITLNTFSPDQAMHQDILKWLTACKFQGLENHPRHPEEDDVVASDQG